MRRPSRRSILRFRLLLPWLLLFLAFPAHAATYSLPGAIGSGPFGSCSLFSGTTYRCGSLVSIGNNDTINLTAHVTLDITSAGFFAGNNVTVNGNGYSLQIIAREDVNIGNSFTGQISISAPGKTINTGNSFTITGSLTASTLNIGNSSTVTGICTPANAKCTGLPPLASYLFDEAGWSGVANEVLDSSGHGYHAQAFNSATTLAAPAAIATNPGTCRFGVFANGSTITKGYVKTPLPNLTTNFTVTAWIRTTNNAFVGSRIFLDDDNNSAGYGFSIDNGAGALRFYSRNVNPVILDSTYTIQNNVWYFVAAVANITSKRRTIHVFNSSGTLLNSTSDSSPFTGTWGTDPGPVAIGGDTDAATAGATAYHFQGYIDEVKVYQSALDQATLGILATAKHACVAATGPDHYELSLPSGSIACLGSTATVTACASSGSPCTSPYAGASGKTASLSVSGGGTLDSGTVVFNGSGVATANLSYPGAADGAAVTVSLSGEEIAATNPRKCCPDGAGCSVANSCSTTFNTAGFLVAASAGGAAATIPTGSAGGTSATYYLRAVQTSGTTQKCEAALSGTSPVSLGYGCVTPAGCSAGSYLDITPYNGAVAQTLQAVPPAGSAVNLIFDANGNAPFSFRYRDSGQIYLSASKAAGGSLLSALSGTSNSFTVDPAYFSTAAVPGCGGFSYSGQAFSLTVTARESSAGSITPNYSGAAGARIVNLSDANAIAGTLATSGTTCAGPCIDATSFAAGVAAVTTPKFTFLAAATAPSSIKLRATDAAGVSSASGGEATASIYSGRLRLFNAYGSDLLPLRVPARVEYYTGSGWAANAADACTGIPATAVTIGNRQPAGLGSGVSSVQALGAGNWSIILAKPSQAGVADVGVNLGSGVVAGTNVCLGGWSNGPDASVAPSPGLTHLSGQWCASPALSVPLARVKFGASKAPYIYLRERF